jgi:hypothetical protein
MFMSMKNSNDTIGNRTRDLPACSAVPQPTVPPRKWLRKPLISQSSSCPGLKSSPEPPEGLLFNLKNIIGHFPLLCQRACGTADKMPTVCTISELTGTDKRYWSDKIMARILCINVAHSNENSRTRRVIPMRSDNLYLSVKISVTLVTETFMTWSMSWQHIES